MAMTTKIDKRGRITIPISMRKIHNLSENTEFLIEELNDDTFILKKIDLEKLIKSVKKEIINKDIEKIHKKVEEEADLIAKNVYSS